MPRVHTKTKSSRGREYRCSRCSNLILPGQRYHEWTFRYGGSRRVHADEVSVPGETSGTYRVVCSGHWPRSSELTQSRMGEVYAAVEAYEDADDLDAKADALEQLAEVAQEVAESYRDAAEPFGGAGENAERADELEPWAEDLAEKASALREAVDAIANADEVAGSCPL